MSDIENILAKKWLHPFLLGLSLVYEALVLFRLWAYQKKWLKSYRPKSTVISVGNITVGGSGKTPVVDFLVQTFKQNDLKVCILSRGYGRKTQSDIQRLKSSENIPSSPSSFGDEPFLLSERHPDIPVYVGSSRTRSVRLAEEWDQPEVVILDDAYQHLAIERDLNLLLIDAERGLGNRFLLPRGELREPEHHWDRADAVILTKANLGFSDAIHHMLKSDLKITCPIFKFDYIPQKLSRLDGKATLGIREIGESRIQLISGIAQPAGFERVMEQLGGKIAATTFFKDHHSYQQEDLKKMIQQYQKIQPDLWITTEKDAVKLRDFPELHEKMWVLEMGVQPDQNWSEFIEDFSKNKLKPLMK